MRMFSASSSFVIIVLLVLLSESAAHAQNVLYLPGDAFFHGTLSEEAIASAKSSGRLSLKYASPSPGSLSGYSGYSRLDVLTDEDFIRQVSLAYLHYRLGRPLEQVVNISSAYEEDLITIKSESVIRESNPPGAFVYNRDFNVDTLRLATKYNEDWAKEVRLFVKHSDAKFFLDEFPRTYECVNESWKNASSTPRLNAELPRIELTPGKAVDIPVTCKCDDVVVMITHFANYNGLFNAADSTEIFIVTSDKIEYCVGRNGKWEKEQLPKLVDLRTEKLPDRKH